MSKLILLRGPSGTGKTTIGKSLFRKENEPYDVLYHMEASFHETDQFFSGVDGKYHFNIAKLSSAHRWNQLQTERSMLHGIPVVIVANTFIAHWEMERYLELAAEYHYDTQLIRTPGPWDVMTLFERNKHNVPLDVIKRHVNGYQPHENDELWTDMSIFVSAVQRARRGCGGPPLCYDFNCQKEDGHG